jgi:hypothetical protein
VLVHASADELGFRRGERLQAHRVAKFIDDATDGGIVKPKVLSLRSIGHELGAVPSSIRVLKLDRIGDDELLVRIQPRLRIEGPDVRVIAAQAVVAGDLAVEREPNGLVEGFVCRWSQLETPLGGREGLVFPRIAVEEVKP